MVIEGSLGSDPSSSPNPSESPFPCGKCLNWVPKGGLMEKLEVHIQYIGGAKHERVRGKRLW